jgi:hypothetical protein
MRSMEFSRSGVQNIDCTRSGILVRSYVYSIAIPVLVNGHDIRAGQDLPAQKDVRTPMIHAHVSKRDPAGVRRLLRGL